MLPPLFSHFFSTAQLEGKIQLLADKTTYQVSIIPSVNWSPPESTSSSAQITLRAPTGTVSITNFQNLTGIWTPQAPIISPAEAPEFDYLSFNLSLPMTGLEYVSGVEMVLFTFENDNGCVEFELIDNQNDPFLPPNSLSINIGHQFTVVASGLGQNAYAGNTSQFKTSCTFPLVVNATAAIDSLLCKGDRTSINIQVIGGTAPYGIAWQNTSLDLGGTTQILDFEGSTSLPNLPAGSYSIIITDSQDSSRQLALKIIEPEAIVFSLQSSDASCTGSADGQAAVMNISGGTISNAYSYLWGEFPNQNVSVLQNINSGMYHLTVTDDNNCQATDSVLVNTHEAISATVGITNVSCSGAADGEVTLSPSGGQPPFTFNWTGNGLTGTQAALANLPGGKYFFTLTDATGVCHFVDSLSVVEPPPIFFDLKTEVENCVENGGGTIRVQNVTNAVEPFLVSLDGENFLSQTTFAVEPGQSYTLRLQDANGCEQSKEVSLPGGPLPKLSLEEEFFIKLGDSVALKPTISPTDLSQFNWTPSQGLSCADCPDPIAKPFITTTYQLTATDTFGCAATQKLTIFVNKKRNIYIPNAFSPNADGVNDFFTFYTGLGFRKTKSLAVFNRWGSLMYQAPQGFTPNVSQLGWDGSFKGKKMEAGVYLYSISIEFIDGEVEQFGGEIQLIR